MRKYAWWSASVLALAGAGSAPAWWVEGHATVAEAAAACLPESVPAFFRAAGKVLGYLAGDPDRWKNPQAKHLRAAEFANHFLDLEDVPFEAWPANRNLYVARLLKAGREPDKVGLLPYALMEGYDRLTVAFYDYRKDPNNEAVRMKCLVYGGVLAHYTGDTVMPLHTTRDYDGRKDPDGQLVQKGIHAKIDGFPEKNQLAAEEMARGVAPRPIEDMWKHVRETILASHKHVARCYELDEARAFDQPTPESRAFILERCREGTQFTLDLWYNAWLRSATLPPHY